MNSRLVAVGVLGGAGLAFARGNLGSLDASRKGVSDDSDLAGLSTPTVLSSGKSEYGIQLNAFGGFDKVTRTGFSYAAGIAKNWEASLAATLGKESSMGLINQGVVDYGGSAGDLLVKYRLPGSLEASLEGGLGYSHTPGQLNKVVGLVAASLGWSPAVGVRFYANPKFVNLDDNALVGIGLGAVVDLSRRVRLFGQWTPLISGDNGVSSFDGSRERLQLYAVGIRFPDVLPRTTLDLGYTNVIGQTYGFSLTPSVGNTGGLYVGLTYHS